MNEDNPGDQTSYMRRLRRRLALLDRQMRDVLGLGMAFDSAAARKYLQKKIDQIRYRLVILTGTTEQDRSTPANASAVQDPAPHEGS